MRRGRPWLALTVIAAAAGAVRWQLAELADWGIDEAANLWLGSLILGGEMPRLGLVSSVGTPNLAGAPLLAAPLARLPDLLAVSRVLSLLQLIVLLLFALVLARKRGRATAALALAFCPAALLSSFSLWNQYLALPINAAITALLVLLVESRIENGTGRRGAPAGSHATGLDAALLLIALLLLQPSVHLAGFADLAAQGGLALVLIGAGAPRVRRIGVELGIAIGGCAAYILYAPWLVRMFGFGVQTTLAVYIAALMLVLVATTSLAGRLRPALHAIGEWRPLAWAIPAVLAVCAATAALSFFGAQLGARLLLTDRWGTALLAAQALLAAIALPALPAMLGDCARGLSPRALLEAWFGERWHAAAVLLANAALLLAARAAVAPGAFTSNGRPDLLLPLLPALLAPALLLASATTSPTVRRGAAGASAIAAAVVIAFVAGNPVPRVQQADPFFLPASEMGVLVDWVAEQPEAVGDDGRLDVAYALGREALVDLACSPGTYWYTPSRPFDWLFLRRHGRRDRRDGECRRADGGRLLVTYRTAAAPPGRRLRLTLPHLAVWE